MIGLDLPYALFSLGYISSKCILLILLSIELELLLLFPFVLHWIHFHAHLKKVVACFAVTTAV